MSAAILVLPALACVGGLICIAMVLAGRPPMSWLGCTTREEGHNAG